MVVKAGRDGGQTQKNPPEDGALPSPGGVIR